jgi:hypothetical protein
MAGFEPGRDLEKRLDRCRRDCFNPGPNLASLGEGDDTIRSRRNGD